MQSKQALQQTQYSTLLVRVQAQKAGDGPKAERPAETTGNSRTRLGARPFGLRVTHVEIYRLSARLSHVENTPHNPKYTLIDRNIHL